MGSRATTHAVLALGGNVGDVVGAFGRALAELPARGVQVLRTSNLFLSGPMHVRSQPTFLNAAALVATAHSPQDLLLHLKDLEVEAGRDLAAPRWCPRPLDLDIIFFGGRRLRSRTLELPHARWHERPFVTVPVGELYRERGPACPGGHDLRTSLQDAHRLAESHRSDVRHVCPGPGGALHHVGARTLVMGIINATPDSFSDGGENVDRATAQHRAERMLEMGCDVVDIGGQSTRPGAATVSEAQELDRVVPLVEGVAAAGMGAVSVDTFRASVAREAVRAGATMVNDVSAGQADPDMYSTVLMRKFKSGYTTQVAEAGVRYVMMHRRGDAATMQSPSNTEYADLEAEIAAELQVAADGAAAAGVHSWNVFLDPGIGFAKTAVHSARLLRTLPRVRQHLHGPLRRMPQLVGASRKSFLGRLTKQNDPALRDFATVAACTAAIGSGADVIRVHNWQAGLEAAAVADAVYRVPRASEEARATAAPQAEAGMVLRAGAAAVCGHTGAHSRSGEVNSRC